MRLKLTLLILLTWLVATVCHAQDLDREVSLQLIDQPIAAFITEISKQSSFKFAYNPNILDGDKISIQTTSMPVRDALELVLAERYDYKIRGSYIILLPKTSEPPKEVRVQKITGAVIDEATNESLEDVSVYEISSLKPVLTNAAGEYDLEVKMPEDLVYIAISKAHYEDTIIAVKNWSTPFQVFLKQKPVEVKTTLLDSLKLPRIFRNKKAEAHALNVELNEVRFAQLSLTPGASTNGFFSGKFTNRFSTNIIAGYAYALHGFEMGGVLNMERMEAHGVQLSGLMNIVGGKLDGLQMAGMTNLVLKNADGLQLAGFSNHAKTVSGGQVSGAINTASELNGLQGSGFINTTKGISTGVQISGFLNYTRTLKGIQIGVVNVANEVESGLMIGVLNWAKNGMRDFEVSTNDVMAYNVSFKSGTKDFYTILSGGIDPHRNHYWDYGMGFGSRLMQKKKISMDIEATYHTIQRLSGKPIEGFNAQIRSKIRVGYTLAPNLTLLTGPIFHYLLFKPKNPDDLSFAEAFGKNPILDHSTPSKGNKGWIGYELAIQF